MQYDRRFPPLPTEKRVATHTRMKRFTITKDKLRDFGLVAVIVAGFCLYAHDQDEKAEAQGNYWGCYTDSCRSAVRAVQEAPPTNPYP